jgi:hypothetical protein
MRGPATTTVRSPGTARRASGNAGPRAAGGAPPRRAAPGDDADPFVGPVAEFVAHLVAVEVGGVEAGDVAGEVVVVLGPLPDPGEVGSEPVGDDVVGVADEDRAVAHAGTARDVLDHLGVVVGGARGLAVAALRHRQPPDEVCEPGVGVALELGVLPRRRTPCWPARSGRPPPPRRPRRRGRERTAATDAHDPRRRTHSAAGRSPPAHPSQHFMAAWRPPPGGMRMGAVPPGTSVRLWCQRTPVSA